MARENQDKNIDTVLFFDEANTTEALSMIKEVMVDRRIRGRPIGQGLERLQFIAACNPYRRWYLSICLYLGPAANVVLLPHGTELLELNFTFAQQ